MYIQGYLYGYAGPSFTLWQFSLFVAAWELGARGSLWSKKNELEIQSGGGRGICCDTTDPAELNRAVKARDIQAAHRFVQASKTQR